MLKIGIIGAGRMATAHAGNLLKLKDVEIAAAYDINPGKSRAFVEKFPGVRVMNSAEEVANSADVDLIVITSPTHCHIEGLRAAMSAGKPIFCEKPLCRTRAQFEELVPLLRSYKNVFAIGFCRRYSAGFMTLKKRIDEGKIGNLICASVTCLFGGYAREWGDWFADYQKSGGVILDMLAHHCDLLNGLFGKPESVYAQAFMLDEKVEKPRDYVSATVRFPKNIICNMECSWLRGGPNQTDMVVYGDKGALKLSDNGLTFFDIGSAATEIEVDDGILGPLQDVISGGMYATEMAKIVDCARNGDKPYAGVEEAIAAMEFGLAMMESSETGNVSKL